MIGRVIEQYRVLEKIGSGGMGSVYKAHDTKLDRAVALKFLHLDRGDDEGAKERFIREAKSASALDHPNICTIYDISETEDGQLYIVMAYYDGDTLKSKIKSGNLSAGEVLNLASQLAEGLKAAHREGIVHRDIKPANLLVTSDGSIKILDFGLAKVASSQITKTGSTIGTTAYMSPEQLRGEEVDHQADIWSFGVVLYELLTGRLPFDGDYPQAIIYSILNQSQAPIDTHSFHLRAELEPLVTKLLKKNKTERYKEIDHVLVDIMIILKSLSDKTLGAGVSPIRLYPARTIVFAAFGILLIMAASYLLFGWLGLFGGPNTSALTVDDDNWNALTRKSEFSESPSFSYDGTKVAYSRARDESIEIIWELLGRDAENILELEVGQYTNPSWSPVDDKIVYASSGDGIWVSAVPAVSPEKIADFGNHPKWSADGQRVLFDHGGDIFVTSSIPKLGDHPEPIVEGTGSSNTYAQWSLDGSHVLYWDTGSHDVVRKDLNSAIATPLELIRAPNEIGGMSLSREGDLFYSKGTFGGSQVLWHIGLDPNTLERVTEPKQLTNFQSDYTKCHKSPATEMLVCMNRDIPRYLYRYPLDTDIGAVSFADAGLGFSRGDKSEYPAFSQDGSKLLWTSHDEGEGRLVVQDRSTREFVNVTQREQNAPREAAGSFGSDGEIIFASTRDNVYGLQLVPRPRTRSRSLITAPEGTAKDLGPVWSPAADEVVFFSTRDGSFDIWWVSLDDPDNPVNLTDWSESEERYPTWTTDGQQITFVSNRTGNQDIWIVDKDGGNARPLIESDDEEAWPLWHPTDNHLYYSSNRGGTFNVWMKDFDTGDTARVTDFPNIIFGMPERSMLTKFAISETDIVLPLEYRTAQLILLDIIRD